MLDNQDFITAVATIVKKETNKAVDVEAKRDVRRQNVDKAALSTAARLTSSNDRSPVDISNKRTNEKTYSETSEEPKPELPPWNEVTTAGSNSRRNKPRTEKELDVRCLKITEQVKDRFDAAVDYQNYRLLNK